MSQSTSMGLFSEVVDERALDNAVSRFRERNILVPTFAEMADPTLAPTSVTRALEMKHTGRVSGQVLCMNRVGGAVIPEQPVHPNTATRNHMRSPIGSSRRHPIVRRLFQPFLDSGPFKNTLVGLRNAVSIGNLGPITYRAARVHNVHASSSPDRRTNIAPHRRT